jgi:uncharacterized membrane protein YbhN (UPF0104 family)
MTAAVDRDRARRERRRRRSRSANARTTAWLAAKILLLSSVIALGAAMYLAWSPVTNPGVQDCGSPVGFFLTDRENVTISPGLPGAPENAVELAEQPTCRDLAEVEIRKAAIAGGAFFGLALVGVLIGLLDDRIAYWRAPRFESLLRPMDRTDRIEYGLVPNVDVDELGAELPPLERPEVVGLAVLGLAVSIGLLFVGPLDATRAVASRIELGPVLVALLLSFGAYLAAMAQRRPVFGPRSGSGEILELTVATSWAGTLRPLVGAFGIDVHHLRKRGALLDDAVERVQSIESISALAHVVLLGVATVLLLGTRLPYVTVDVAEWILVSLLAVTLLVGLARLPRRWRAAPVKPGRAAARGLRALARRPAELVTLIIATLALTAARVVALVWCLGAFGTELDLTLVLWLYLAVVILGGLAPTPNGVGVIEIALVLGFFFAGVHIAVAVCAVLTYRVLTAWLPLLPGWRASRSLHRSGGL